FQHSSQIAVGTVLEHRKGDVIQPLIFFSAKLTSPNHVTALSGESFWHPGMAVICYAKCGILIIIYS
ncbi:unnamed protein product, partial [Hymenolepis diminuta]